MSAYSTDATSVPCIHNSILSYITSCWSDRYPGTAPRRAQCPRTAKYATTSSVSRAEFKETAVKNLGVDCLWISPSSAGLLVSTWKPGGGAVAVLDPETLEPKRTYPILEGYRAVSAPGLAVAYIGPGKKGLPASTLGVLDLKTHKFLADYRNLRGGPFPVNGTWNFPVMSQDGKYLFTVGGNNGIV